MAGGVVIRRATLEDRQGVLEINPFVSDGLDYLPTMYPALLQDPNFRGYVALINGEIVSLAARFLDVEDGICCFVSGRTKDNLKGKGIQVKLVGLMQSELDIPTGKKVDFLSVSSEKPKIHRSAYWAQPGRLLIDRMEYLVYLVSYENIMKGAQLGRNQVQHVKVEDLGPDKAYKVLTDAYTLKHVLRSSHLMAFTNCLPVPKTKKYLKKIATQCKVCVTFKTGPPADVPQGISFSCMMFGHLFVNFDVYMYVYDHVDIVLAHVTRHLQHLSGVIDNQCRVAVRLYFPTQIDKEIVKDFLVPALGRNRISKVHPLEFAIIEMHPQQSNHKSNL